MAIIPLKQVVSVIKRTKQQVDGWTEVVEDSPEEYKVRVTEFYELKEATSTAGGTLQIPADAAKFSATIFFNKIPDLDYESIISFTDESGKVYHNVPKSIKPIRMVNGKVTLTEVKL